MRMNKMIIIWSNEYDGSDEYNDNNMIICQTCHHTRKKMRKERDDNMIMCLTFHPTKKKMRMNKMIIMWSYVQHAVEWK